MMEPTTVIALRSMEKAGLIRRARMSGDKRVANVCLTAKAKRIREQMLSLARGINEDACQGLSRDEFETFRRAITRMTENLDRVMR
jgi:MarR family transcriptional regulator, organic hydroperoxide resistance regulator